MFIGHHRLEMSPLSCGHPTGGNYVYQDIRNIECVTCHQGVLRFQDADGRNGFRN